MSRQTAFQLAKSKKSYDIGNYCSVFQQVEAEAVAEEKVVSSVGKLTRAYDTYLATNLKHGELS